jgi:hypothetical protein
MPENDSTSEKAPRLALGIFIVDWTKRAVLAEVFDELELRFHMMTKGRGTASSEILDALGIGSTEKAVVIVLEEAKLLARTLGDVTKKLSLRNPGAGIAFTSPLSAVNQPVLSAFAHEKRVLDTGEGEKMEGNDKIVIKYDLIIAVINQGYSEEFMTKAREAGAGGGTVLNARSSMHKGPVKFLGITVQDEKEIIMILSTREKRDKIMEAVSKSHGVTTKAEGIIFSLPVDAMSGVDLR